MLWLWQGYARLNQAEAALDVMRDFWQQGGDPDDSMFEVLVTLCVRTGEFRKALQVVHAMDRLGRHADKMRIKKVLEEFYRCGFFFSLYCAWTIQDLLSATFWMKWSITFPAVACIT